MAPDKHSLNAKVDLIAYRELKYVLKEEGKSINSGMNSIIKEYVKAWKKKNNVVEIPEKDLES